MHFLPSDGNASFLRAARAGNVEKVIEYLKGSIDINTSNANGLNALHLASKESHVAVVLELVKRGANVNAATKKGNTALHIASLAGQEEVVQILIRNGANVNVQSQNGFTPLYMAAQENHDGVVKFLLANGANQSLATEDGFTPLAVALQQGHDKVVAVLLENDAKGRVRLPALHIAAKKDDCKAAALLLQNDHDPDVTSKSGFTPLHIAAHYGNENIGTLLLEKNADVNYAAKHQITPLHVAAKWGKSNMVTLLLDKGAKIDASTRDGLTPLHCAARSGHDQVVDLLLEKGAPITAKTKNGLAPLHMASQGDHVDSSRILLYHKAPVDDVTVDYLTALHVAAHCGHVRVAKLLLDRKADPNARALNGFTPLHIACKKNRIKVVELLLKHGASIEATTESGLTPLHVASFMGCMNIVIYLIQHGANPDVPTIRGETPLHLAARANQSDIIRILLRNGAHVDAAAREQQTPLHIAARLGNVDIVGLLLQHGAAVDSTTKDMYTALHIAAKEGQEEVASVLLDNGASLTSTTKKGFTPLHLAAKYGNIKVARLLLQKDAPVDAQGKNGVTPLHVAAHYDHVNVALLLLDKGAFPHATAKNGYTPLHIAAKKNQMDIATTLLEYGAKPSAESKAGFTPLHLAAQEGHTDMTTLLIEHHADVNSSAKNGLTPLHLCAQEDRVNVAAILVKNGATVDPPTKAGYTPLHVACHFGQINMIRFLLQHGADVNAVTSHGYTPLHQAAQQGHTLIINLLLEHKASPNTTTNQGQTALSIAQRLGYISVVETLKIVTETVVTTTTTTVTEEKYKVVAPETMQETFMSDSEDEGAEDTMLGDQSFKYLTADEMKSLGDDSLPIDVTRDERGADSMLIAPPTADEEHLTPQHIVHQEMTFTSTMVTDNVDIARAPVHAGFLVSFMVDARGGAMRGCRHSGVRVIIPPRKASMPMRITCRYLRKEKLAHPPPLMEGEACASRILEVGPAGAKFLGPVIIEVPHFASLRGREREITILRSDNGETWREHIFEASEDTIHDVFNESFEGDDLTALDDLNTSRITRILTNDFPQYFAIITRIRQEVHAIGPDGGMVSSTVVPQVQAIFQEGALTKKIKVGLQAHPINPELVTKLLGNRVAVSPIVTVEPRRRKFHKPITLTIPVPQAATKGMINQYSGDAPTLRLLCSITGGTTKAQWEDVTGSTPLTFVNDCVSFTTTVSARFWLMDCRQVNEATKFATELYREAIHVPFMAKFVVFAKRHDPLEAQLRVFCMTDDKEDKTLECQEHFTEVAKSRDVEVLEGKSQFLEFAGNLIPVTKSGEQLKLTFQAFRENRLPFIIRVKDPHQEPLGRVAFMREPRVGRGEPPQTPICNLNISLPEAETSPVSELVTLEKKYGFVEETGLAKPELIHRADLRLSDIAKELRADWVPLALQLDIPESDINAIRSECVDDYSEQALRMLRLWLQRAGNKATGNCLEKGLRKINREDIVNQCMFNVELVTDDVEKAVAKVHLDQSGFDTFKEELGSSRDASLRRETSLNGTYDERDIMKEAESAAETSSEGSDKETHHFAVETEVQRAEKESLEDALADQIIITPDRRSISEEATVVNHHEEAVTSETVSHVSSNQRFTESSCHDEEVSSDQTSATISSETAAEYEISSGEDRPQTEAHVEKKAVPGCRTSIGVLRNSGKEGSPRIHSMDGNRRNLQTGALGEMQNISSDKFHSKNTSSLPSSVPVSKTVVGSTDAAKRSAIKKDGVISAPKKVSFVSHSRTLSPAPRRRKSLVVRRNSWPPVSAVDQGTKRKRYLYNLRKKLDLSYFYNIYPDDIPPQSLFDWLQAKGSPETSTTKAPLANFDEFRELDIHSRLKSLLLSNIPFASTKWSNNLIYSQNNLSNYDKCLKFYFKPKWYPVSGKSNFGKQNLFNRCSVNKDIGEIFKGKNGLQSCVGSPSVTSQPQIYPKLMSQELPHYIIDQTADGTVGLVCNSTGKIDALHYPVSQKAKYCISDSIYDYDVSGPVCVNNITQYHSNMINGFSWNSNDSLKNASEISYTHSFNHEGNDLAFNFLPERQQMCAPNVAQVSGHYSSPINKQMTSGKLSTPGTCISTNITSSPWGNNGIPEHHTKNPFNPVKSGQPNPPGVPSFNSPVQPAINVNAPSGKISSRPVNPTTPSGDPSTRPVSNPSSNPSQLSTSNPVEKSTTQSTSNPASNPVGNPAENPSGGSTSDIPSKPTDSEKDKSKKQEDDSSDKSKDKSPSKKDKSPEKQNVKPEAVQSTVVAQTFLKSLLEQSKLEEEAASKPIPAAVIGQAFLKTLSEQSCEPQECAPSQAVPSSVIGQVFLKSLIEQVEVPKTEAPKPVPASVVGQAFLKTLFQQSEAQQTEAPVSLQTEEAHKKVPLPVPSTVVGQAFLKTLLQEGQTKEESPKVIPSSVIGQTFLKTLAEQQVPASETKEAPHAVPASVVGQSFLKMLLESPGTSEMKADQQPTSQETEKSHSIPAPVVGQAFLKTLLQQSEKSQTMPEGEAPSVVPASVVGQAFLKTLIQQVEPVEKPVEPSIPSAVVGQAFLKTLLEQSDASESPATPESESQQPVPSSVVGQAFLKTLLEKSADSGTQLPESSVDVQGKPGAHETLPAVPASVVGQAFLKTLLQQTETAAPVESKAHPPVPASVVGQAFLKSLVEQSESLQSESKAQEESPPIPSSVVGQAFLKTLLQKSEPVVSSVEESEVSKEGEPKKPVPASVVGQAFLKTLMESEAVKSESEVPESLPVPASVVGQAFLKTLMQESEPVSQEGGTKQPIPAPVVGQAFLKSLLQQAESSSEETVDKKQETEAQQTVLPSSVVGQAFLKTLLQQAEPSGATPSTQETEGQCPVPSTVVGQVFLKTLLQQSESGQSPSTTESKPSVKSGETQPIPAPVVGQAFLKTLLMQSEGRGGEAVTTEAPQDFSSKAVPASVVGQAFLKTLLQQSEPAAEKSHVESTQHGVKPQASAAQHSVPASVVGQTFLKALLQQSESAEVKHTTGQESKQGEGEGIGLVPASVVGQAFLKTLLQQSETTTSSEGPSQPETSAVKQAQSEAHSSKPIPASVIEQSFLKTLSEQIQSQPEQASSHPVIPASVVGQSFLKSLIQQQPEQEVGESASVIPASVVGQAFLQTLARQMSKESEGSESACSSDKGCGESSPGKCSSGSGCGETHLPSSSQDVSDCPRSSGNVCHNVECISPIVLNNVSVDEVYDMSVKEELCMMKNICEKIISGFYRFHSDNSRKVVSPPQNEDLDFKVSEKCSEEHLQSTVSDKSDHEYYARNSYDPPEITTFPSNVDIDLEHSSLENDVLREKKSTFEENSNPPTEDVTSLDLDSLENESQSEKVAITGGDQICQKPDVHRRDSKKSDKQGAPRTSAEIRGMIFDVWKITEELQDIVGNLDSSFGLNVQNEILESCSSLTTKSPEPGKSDAEEAVCFSRVDVCAENDKKDNADVPLISNEALASIDVTPTEEESLHKASLEISDSVGSSKNVECMQLYDYSGGSNEDLVVQLEDTVQVENSAADSCIFSLSGVPCEVNWGTEEIGSSSNMNDLQSEETDVCLSRNSDISSVTKYLNDLRILCSEGKLLLNQLSLQLQKESLAKTAVNDNSYELKNDSCTELRIAPVCEDVLTNVNGSVESEKVSEDLILQSQPSPSEVSAFDASETSETGAVDSSHAVNLSSSDQKQTSVEDTVSYVEEKNSSLSATFSECATDLSIENDILPSAEQFSASQEVEICMAQLKPQEHTDQWNGNNGNQEDFLFSAIFLPPPEFRNTPSDYENEFSCCSSDPKCIKMENMLAKHSLGSINELLSFTDLMQRIIETMADPV